MIDVSKEYIVERFIAFDRLPLSVKKVILEDPMMNNLDFINEVGFQSYVLSLGQLAMDMSRCESPIEMLLFVGMERLRYRCDIWDIEPQKEIIIDDKKYRVDFLITFGDRLTEDPGKLLIIECDGHDFHERTKQQAARDRQRDRDMQIAGYSVMRFTGSEIYKNPNLCAEEIDLFIKSAMNS